MLAQDSSISHAARSSSGWRYLAAFLMFGLLLVIPARGATAPQRKQAVANGPSPAAHRVGNDTCASCHDTEAKAIDGNAHARLALEHGGKGDTCESCHGAGSEHVDSGGDATKIFSFAKASSTQSDAVCLSCHASAHPNFQRTAHGEAGVACTSCHSAHHSKTEEAMLIQPQPQLCYRCHTDVKPAFEQAFHHKVNEGVMSCSDCHDPHGSFQKNNLRAAADQNQICMKCHSDTAGPFVYEHPTIKTEGCTSCHSPHGSQNARLLTQNNVNSLCMQCHTASSLFTTPGTPSFHNQANQYQACTVCHTQIHGSNASNIFFK